MDWAPTSEMCVHCGFEVEYDPYSDLCPMCGELVDVEKSEKEVDDQLVKGILAQVFGNI